MISPSVVISSVAPVDGVSVVPVQLRLLHGTLDDLTVEHDAPTMNISHEIYGDTLLLEISSDVPGGSSEGRILVTHDGVKYTIPVLLYHTSGTVATVQDGGRLGFTVSHPDGWSFAKITVTGRNGDSYHTSTVPGQPPHIDVYENGLYYVQADIVTDSRGSSVYDYVLVDSVLPDVVRPQDSPDIPWRQVGIAASVAAVVGVGGLLVRFMIAGRRRLSPAPPR